MMTDYTILTCPSFKFIGVPLRTSNEEAFRTGTISAHWNKFYQDNIKEQIPNRLNETLIGLYRDYETDYTGMYTLIIGCEVSSLENIPEGMVGITVPTLSYAVFTAQGEFPAALIETWKSVWNSAVDRSYNADLEVYDEHFFSDNPEVTLFISLKEGATYPLG
jgi:predicted transcriptional regulator YdeE